MYLTAKKLQDILQQARKGPVFIFLHSLTCSISAHVKEEVDAFVKEDNSRKVILVAIQRQEDLSRQIEKTLGVEHESPQVIFLEKEEVKGVLNHYEITGEHLEELLNNNKKTRYYLD